MIKTKKKCIISEEQLSDLLGWAYRSGKSGISGEAMKLAIKYAVEDTKKVGA